VVTGAFGFLWLILWRWIYHPPHKHPKISNEELAHIRSNNEQDTIAKTPWPQYFKYKAVWGVALSRFVSDGAFYFFVFWLPSWLADEKGFSLIEIGLFAWIPFVLSDIGSFVGGWTSSYLMTRGLSLDASRKWTIWVGALLTITLLGHCLDQFCPICNSIQTSSTIYPAHRPVSKKRCRLSLGYLGFGR